MEKVAIVGVGLIGASFGLALRKAGFTGAIIGVSSPPALAAGLEAGAISQTASLRDGVEQADLIYLAQPVDRIIKTLEEIGPWASSTALITDAGSTKVAIGQAAAAHLRHAQFMGGHPMAGKEVRGASSASADLFAGRPYILESTPGDRAQEFRTWLKRIGAQVVEMNAEQHDATVALTSHLPQMLSSALAAFLASQPEGAVGEVFGSGLLDMTRLSLSSADLWFSIIGTNPENVKQAISGYISTLTQLNNSIGTSKFYEVFSTSATFSANLRKLNH